MQRSTLSFSVIILFAIILAIFVVRKGNDAANELDRLNSGAFAVHRTALADELYGGAFDISSWKIYRNKKYGFEFKYPSEWELNVYEESTIESVIEVLSPSAQKRPKGTHVFGPLFDVRVIFNKSYQGKIMGERVEFFGNNAVDTGWHGSPLGGNLIREIAILMNPEITFYLGGSGSEAQKSEMAKLEPILSTFKFIK